MDFGQKYQLALYDPATREGNKLAYVPPGMWYYLLSRPHLTLVFPFIYLAPPPVSYPFTAPVQYDGVEVVGGLLPTAPFVALRPGCTVRPARDGSPCGPGLDRRRVADHRDGQLRDLGRDDALRGRLRGHPADRGSARLDRMGRTSQRSATTTAGRQRRAADRLGRRMRSGVRHQGLLRRPAEFSPKTYTRLQNLTSPIPTLISAIDGKPKTIDIVAPPGLESNTDPNEAWAR